MAKSLIMLWLSLWLLPATAQPVVDPTRPPAAFLTEAGRAASADEAAGKALPVLQSIIRLHGARPTALIDGQVVVPGGRVGDWVLVRIRESEVELRGENGRETLVLSPGVDRHLHSATMRRRGQ